MGWLMGNHHGPSLTDEQLEDFSSGRVPGRESTMEQCSLTEESEQGLLLSAWPSALSPACRCVFTARCTPVWLVVDYQAKVMDHLIWHVTLWKITMVTAIPNLQQLKKPLLFCISCVFNSLYVLITVEANAKLSIFSYHKLFVLRFFTNVAN